MQVPKDIVLAFAKSHVPLWWQLSPREGEFSPDLQAELDELMRQIPEQIVRARFTDPRHRSNYDGQSDKQAEQEARREILVDLISSQVNETRIELLREKRDGRVAPYDHEALLDLQVDEDNLVLLNQFELQNRRLERLGYVFELALTLRAENSSYWLKQHLLSLVKETSVFVRLDPLAVQSRSEYREMMYKMWVYGVPLDWAQIASLREALHGRWMPSSPLGIPSSFTDVVWSPRGDEVHFLCEEVPLLGDFSDRGSRYFHSILQRETGRFIHADGAIRFYNEDELNSRLKLHLRHTGKVGHRVKIFRVDGGLVPEALGGLASSFFVWNEDVANYFAGACSFPTENP